MIPRYSSASFTIPSFCSSTIQAVVRTRSEVQNGSKTRIISRFAMSAVPSPGGRPTESRGDTEQRHDEADGKGAREHDAIDPGVFGCGYDAAARVPLQVERPTAGRTTVTGPDARLMAAQVSTFAPPRSIRTRLSLAAPGPADGSLRAVVASKVLKPLMS